MDPCSTDACTRAHMHTGVLGDGRTRMCAHTNAHKHHPIACTPTRLHVRTHTCVLTHPPSNRGPAKPPAHQHPPILCTQELIEKGAYLEQNSNDELGYTPLLWTAFGDGKQSTDIARMLLMIGADVCACSNFVASHGPESPGTPPRPGQHRGSK